MNVAKRVALVAVHVFFEAVPAKFHVDSKLIAYAESVKNTNSKVHRIEVVSHCTTHTTTEERNNIPNTIRIVTQYHVAYVQQNMFVQVPELVRTILAVNNRLTPNSLQFGTQTDARSKPLTYSYRSTRTWTELFEWACWQALSMFFVWIPCVPVATNLDKPVAPERVGCHAILLYGVWILRHWCCWNTSKRQYNQ